MHKRRRREGRDWDAGKNRKKNDDQSRGGEILGPREKVRPQIRWEDRVKRGVRKAEEGDKWREIKMTQAINN